MTLKAELPPSRDYAPRADTPTIIVCALHGKTEATERGTCFWCEVKDELEEMSYPGYEHRTGCPGQMTQWSSIASAPKDGTVILVWDADNEDIFIVSYYQEAGTWPWRDNQYSARRPTHWMPMPTPPVGC